MRGVIGVALLAARPPERAKVDSNYYRGRIKIYLEKYMKRTDPETLKRMQSPAHIFRRILSQRFQRLDRALAEAKKQEAKLPERKARREQSMSDRRLLFLCQRSIDEIREDHYPALDNDNE